MQIKLNNRLFKSLYSDNAQTQLERYRNAISTFIAEFKRDDFIIISVPGRTEIAGNHTDHQRGKVIAAAVDLDGIAVCAKRDDSMFNILSDGYIKLTVDISDLKVHESEKNTSSALIRGIAAAYRNNKHKVMGADVYFTSDVPVGSGLSSSAQFGVSIANVFNYLYNDGMVDDVENAKDAMFAENEYFGKPSGLMDQMACSVGGIISIDFYDKDNPIITKIPFDLAKHDYTLAVVDTKGSHADLTSEYASMPEEMGSVAAYFGKEVLSQVNEKDFYENLSGIRITCGERALIRAYHYFTEINRVERLVASLSNDEFDYFLSLIRECGRSSYMYLQNAYPSCDINQRGICVAFALSEKILGPLGAVRVHGGGIAGTVLVFIPNDKIVEYKREMQKVFGSDCFRILRIRPYGAVRVL